MVIITSYAVSVLMSFVTMISWGSWANTQKLVGKKDWPFQLFYWDYVIGLFLLSLVIAFTMGSYGSEGRPFLADLKQAGNYALMSAFISGVFFNASNILLVIAIEISGLSVAFPIGVGIALILGVITNYIPEPIGNPYILFTGVALVFFAMVLSA
ncbi:MAG: multidrug DMT transporter permease, partial [Oligoflexales bacterium]|nr:multidrug DMT transporter permease [Oligoflexales bacterium]